MSCRIPAQEGETRRRHQLVLEFMPLARRIARSYHSPRHPDDVEQVAYLALVKAAERFDPARGNRFSTFAVPTIQGEIKHYLRDHSWDVHVPRLLQDRAVQAQRMTDELVAELGRSPTVEELAGRLDASEADVIEALGASIARDARSLDGPSENGADESSPAGPLEVVGGDDENLGRVLDRDALRSVLEVLSHQERQALGLRFLADLTQSEIAQRIGISQMQVSRVLRRALERITETEDQEAA